MRVLLVMPHAIANLIAVSLRHGAYETRTAEGVDYVSSVREWVPDLVMIDLDQRDNGIETVVAASGKPHVPVIGITRRRETAFKLRAFEQGADDIIEVPFTLDEVVARPYAVLRRTRGLAVPIVPRIVLGGVLQVDLLEQTVRMNGSKSLELTPIQQTLLYLLAANAPELLTRETILASIWGGAFQIESNVVDRHIRELRVKLGDDWRRPSFIETVPGKGYRFRANGNSS